MKILKESWQNTVTVEDLKYIRNKIDDLIYELEEEIGVVVTGDLSPNTYGLSMPYIATRNGFIELSDIYRYIPDIYRDDYEEEEE